VYLRSGCGVECRVEECMRWRLWDSGFRDEWRCELSDEIRSKEYKRKEKGVKELRSESWLRNVFECGDGVVE
jgi:hypothetical protein